MENLKEADPHQTQIHSHNMPFCFSSSSSRFGVFLLPTLSIGLLLLMMAPQFGAGNFLSGGNICGRNRPQMPYAIPIASLFHTYTDFEGLECYVENMPVGGRPGDAWLVNKFIFEIMPTANDNQKTRQCPTGLDYCLTLHCQAWVGDKTIKTCVGIRPGYTPEQACAEMHKVCQQDPKFYCHTCQTDKCNNEPENRNAATANDINADNAWSFPLEWEMDEQ